MRGPIAIRLPVVRMALIFTGGRGQFKPAAGEERRGGQGSAYRLFLKSALFRRPVAAPRITSGSTFHTSRS